MTYLETEIATLKAKNKVLKKMIDELPKMIDEVFKKVKVGSDSVKKDL
ncbi:hypothetical protein [Campylobacter ureolyticus]|nr:hypothetical protein [Campylobacter ureolyticus]MDU7070043.1 hypothetical protein [Campylobacter ureolyticus]